MKNKSKKSVNTYRLSHNLNYTFYLTEEEILKMFNGQKEYIDAFKYFCDKMCDRDKFVDDNLVYTNSFELKWSAFDIDYLYSQFDDCIKGRIEAFVSTEFPNGIPNHYPQDEIDKNEKALEKFK